MVGAVGRPLGVHMQADQRFAKARF